MKFDIDRKQLKDQLNRSNVRYNNVYKTLNSRLKFGPEYQDLAKLVKQYGVLFSSTFHAIDEQVEKELASFFYGSSNMNKLYAAYVAARVVFADVSAGSNSELMRGEKLENKLIKNESNSFSLVKNTLEKFADYLSESSRDPKDSVKNYFAEVSNQTNRAVKGNLSNEKYNELKDIHWKICTYQVEGLEEIKFKEPKIVKKSSNKNVNSHTTSEESNIVKPLVYLNVPKDKVLSRDEIIGDKSIITDLERSVVSLLAYNPKFGNNPMKEKAQFLNRAILQGTAGTGKGAVSFYIMNYAKRLSEKLNKDLMITSFDINSTYLDGNITKLKHQMNQICEENRPFFIFQDEIDGILRSDENVQNKNKNSKHDVIQEFNKFLEGEYLNKGNYMILGNVNNIQNLSPSNKRRFEVINWKGAISKEEKGKLFEYKLGSKANLTKSELLKLGELGVSYNLSGGDITLICDKARSDLFNWNNIEEIFNLEDSYESQLKFIDSLQGELRYQDIEKATMGFKENIENANIDSLKFQGA